MARETGELVDWNDDRGFGFIRPAGGGVDVYVHVKSLRRSDPRPRVGDQMSYVVIAGKDGRPAASEVRIAGAAVPEKSSPAPRPARSSRVDLVSARMLGATALLVLLAANIFLGRLPAWVAALYLIAGATAFLFYRVDKRAAGKRASRTPERRLHLLDLAFGIIGGLLAQHFYRHKTHKTDFGVITGLITALHALLLGLILFGVYAPGSLGDVFRRLANG